MGTVRQANRQRRRFVRFIITESSIRGGSVVVVSWVLFSGMSAIVSASGLRVAAVSVSVPLASPSFPRSISVLVMCSVAEGESRPVCSVGSSSFMFVEVSRSVLLLSIGGDDDRRPPQNRAVCILRLDARGVQATLLH